MLVTNPAEPTEMPALCFSAQQLPSLWWSHSSLGTQRETQSFSKSHWATQTPSWEGAPCIHVELHAALHYTSSSHPGTGAALSSINSCGMVMELNVSWVLQLPGKAKSDYPHILGAITIKGKLNNLILAGPVILPHASIFYENIWMFYHFGKTIHEMASEVYLCYVEIKGEDGINTASLEVLCEVL